MKPVDILKALGVALALMGLNVAIAFAAVWAYSAFVEPGHNAAFYKAAAQDIAPWSSVFAGMLLFFAAMRWLAWRRGRNGFAFAVTVAAIYAAIDLSIMAASGVSGAMATIVAASMLSKLGAALFGARLGRPKVVA